MSIEEQLIVKAEGLSLILRDHSIYLNGRPLNFFTEIEQQRIFCDINYDLHNHVINCIALIGSKEIFSFHITCTHNEIIFHIKGNDIIGISWPVQGEVYFGDYVFPAGDSLRSASYGNKNSDSIQIHTPCVHEIEDYCLTCHSSSDIDFDLSYLHEDMYCNAWFNGDRKLSFKRFLNIRQAVATCLKKRAKPRVQMIEFINIESMKNILYNAHDIAEPRGHQHLLQVAKDINSKLSKNKIEYTIVGSMAMSLHGINIDVQDIDIIVASKEDLDKCVKLFDNVEFPHKLSKWHDCAARISLGLIEKCNLDISIMNRFFSIQCLNIKGLPVLNKNDLLTMKLIEESEKKLMIRALHLNHHNHNCVLTMINCMELFAYPFFDNYRTKLMSRFRHLHQLIEGTEWAEEISLDINKPLQANVLKKNNKLLVPVINTGYPCEATIHISNDIKKAMWLPIDDSDELPCELSTQGEIYIPIVREMGLLTF